MQLKPPIFIITTAENGAGLVQGLLDGHPSLNVLPFLCDFYKLYERHQSSGAESLANALVDYPMIKRVLDGKSANAYGDFRGLRFSKKNVLERYFKLTGDKLPDRKTYFYAATTALCEELGFPSDLRLVAHIHFPERADRYVADFPDASWIVCTATISNLLSFFAFNYPRMLQKRFRPVAFAWWQRIHITMQRLAGVAQIPVASMIEIKFEDLLTAPHLIAKRLSDGLGIEDAPSLYRTTALGRKLVCRYPTGAIWVEDGRICSSDARFDVLLHGTHATIEPPLPQPLRSSWFVPQEELDTPWTPRQLKTSLRQTIAEIRYALGLDRSTQQSIREMRRNRASINEALGLQRLENAQGTKPGTK